MQTTWYINAATGSDANDGLTPATAIKTWMGGYVPNVGLRPYINVVVDVYIEGDLDPGDVLLAAGVIGPSGALNIHGAPTTLHAGTLSGIVHYDQPSGQWNELQDGTLDFSPYVGDLVIIQTSNGPAYCYISNAVAPGRARVSLIGQRISGNAFFENLATVSAGDSYTIVQLPFCEQYVEDLVFGASPASINPSLFVELLHLPFYTAVQNDALGEIVHSECTYDDLAIGTTNCTLVNPCFVGEVAVYGSFNTVLGLMLDTFGSAQQGLWFSAGLTLEGSSMYVGPTAYLEVHHDAYGLAMFGCENPLQIEGGGTLLVTAPIWGQDNSGSTLTIALGARVIGDHASTKLVALTPSGGSDVLIDGLTSLPAVDPSTYAFTTARPLSFVTFAESVAAGGFGLSVFNPRFPATGMTFSS